MSPIIQSLLITAIGMGLVFILIVLLWGFMAGLVMLSNRWDFMAKKEDATEEEAAAEEVTATPEVNLAGIAAVAVAAALATGQKVFKLTPQPSTETSSWQAVTRANTLAQISAIFNRKPRG